MVALHLSRRYRAPVVRCPRSCSFETPAASDALSLAALHPRRTSAGWRSAGWRQERVCGAQRLQVKFEGGAPGLSLLCRQPRPSKGALDGLRDLGYIEGQNLAVAYRF